MELKLGIFGTTLNYKGLMAWFVLLLTTVMLVGVSLVVLLAISGGIKWGFDYDLLTRFGYRWFVLAAVVLVVLYRTLPRLAGSWSIFNNEGKWDGVRHLSIDLTRAGFGRRWTM